MAQEMQMAGKSCLTEQSENEYVCLCCHLSYQSGVLLNVFVKASSQIRFIERIHAVAQGSTHRKSAVQTHLAS